MDNYENLATLVRHNNMIAELKQRMMYAWFYWTEHNEHSSVFTLKQVYEEWLQNHAGYQGYKEVKNRKKEITYFNFVDSWEYMANLLGDDILNVAREVLGEQNES